MVLGKWGVRGAVLKAQAVSILNMPIALDWDTCKGAKNKQSEVSQKEKNKYHMLTHIYGILKKKKKGS